MPSFEKITSRENKRLKEAKRIRDGKSDRLIFVEGVRLVEEAASAGIRAVDCFGTPKFYSSDRGSALAHELHSRGTFIHEVPEGVLDTIADTKNSQGIILICERPASREISLKRRIPLIVFLVDVNNPSNLGAIVRSAEAAGAAGMFVSPDSADAYSPKALRASMGSAFRFPIRQNVSFEEALDFAGEKKLISTAAAGDGVITYTQLDWKQPRLLIFGSEGHGLSRDHLNAVDETVLIPMQAPVESLNLGVAAGIILFEARRGADAASVQ